jgi:hypothetical protein
MGNWDFVISYLVRWEVGLLRRPSRRRSSTKPNCLSTASSPRLCFVPHEPVPSLHPLSI